jgi:O-antigen/teichoic acid export membrane protein
VNATFVPSMTQAGGVPVPGFRRALSLIERRLGIDAAMVATVGSRCLGMAAGLVTAIVTARCLLPAGRGEYFLAVTTAQLIAQFGNLGLPSGNTFFVARDRTLFGGLLANSFWMSSIAIPVIGAAILALPMWAAGGGLSATTYWYALIVAPLLVFILLGSGLLVGINRISAFNVAQTMSSGAALPFMLVAAAMGAGSRGFLVASGAGAGITVLFLWRRLAANAGESIRFRPEVFTHTFSYSTKAYLATLAGFVVLRMNVFTLRALAGPEQVGYYSIASQICDPIAILPQSIALVLFPRLAAATSGRLRATVDNALRMGGLLAAICLGVALCAGPAIRLAFGARFAPAVPVVIAMLPGVLCLGVMSIMSQYLAASGFPPSVVVSWLAAVAISGSLGFLLIARMGAVGAAAAVSVTYAGLLVVLVVLCWRTARRGALRQPVASQS